MSMELWVFSDRQAKDVKEWQAAIDAEGYPLQLSSDMPFNTLCGFFPMHLRGELTGCECYHDDVQSIVHVDPVIELEHEWKFALGFRWVGSREKEMLVAWMAATAYAQATDGVILDGEDDRFYAPAQARKKTHDLEHPSPETLAAIREIEERLSRKA